MTSTRVPYWAGALVTAMGLLFMVIGWTMEIQQHYRLTTYQPITARVVESRVQEHIDNKRRTSYEPNITYAYVVQGRQYQNNTFWPVGSVWGSKQSAADICSAYPPDLVTTAWYSPANPASAFLKRHPMPLPQVFALLPLIFFIMGVVLIFSTIQGSRPLPLPIPAGDGWFRLTEEGTLHSRFRLWIAIALIWVIYCAILLGDYVYLNDRHLDLFSDIAVPICAILTFIPLFHALRYWRLGHDFLDADLFIQQNKIRAGDQFNLRIRMNALRSLEIRDLSLGAVCLRSTNNSNHYETKEVCSIWHQIVKDETFTSGQQIAGETNLAISDIAEITSPPRDKTYPYIQWFIALRVQAAGQPKLNARYPIVVEPPRQPR